MPRGDSLPPPLCPFCGSTYPHDCTATKRMMDDAAQYRPTTRPGWEYLVERPAHCTKGESEAFYAEHGIYTSRDPDDEKATGRLNELGAQGWQLMGVFGAGHFVLRREVQS